MRYVLPLILSACAVAEGAAPRPVGLSWSSATTYCDDDGDGLTKTPSVPGAIVQAVACDVDGSCWSVPWGDAGDGWMHASCGRGVDSVEWTWIAPVQ